MPQNPHHRVAQRCVPHVPDVRRLIRIDARMLYNDLSILLCVVCVSALSSLSSLPAVLFYYSAPKYRPLKIRIQIPAPSHLNLGNSLDLPQSIRNLLRNHPGRLLQTLRQLKTHRRGRLAHLNLRRPLQHNR